jgi:hypothetical protein
LAKTDHPCSKLQGIQAKANKMVPRDRIELPTRGFSDQIFEDSKML